MERVSGVYKIESVCKPERVYVGSSVNIHRRHNDHLWELRNQRHHSLKLQRHYNKYGKDDLVFTILEVPPKDKIIEIEQKYIDELNPYFNEAPSSASLAGYKYPPEKLVNRTGRIMKESTRLLKRKLMLGENNPFYGRRHTDKTKKIISDKKKGIPGPSCRVRLLDDPNTKLSPTEISEVDRVRMNMYKSQYNKYRKMDVKNKKLFVLHVGFHRGCCESIKTVFHKHKVSLYTKYLPIGVDGYDYFMTKEASMEIWERDKDFFNCFDVIITSDTAPLSQIFLRGGYGGKLIIWVCNRFDYSMEGKEKEEYIKLLVNSKGNTNVHIIGYNEYESVYCNRYGVCVEDTIRPVYKPNDYNKIRDVYYIPDYQNNYNYNLMSYCLRSGLNVIGGRHNGVEDMARFMAVIHLPYHWQGIQNAELLSVGTPYYVPSKEFLIKLSKTRPYWFQNVGDLEQYIELCDFYNPLNKDFMFYFDSFEDIKDICPDYDAIHKKANDIYEFNKKKWEYLLWS
jgi:group I intron endonuclease